MTLSLTLVVPCYREAERLEPARFLEFLDATEATRLLLVDDGSPDDTLRVLRELAARRPDRIEVLPLAKNAGKGEAVRLGLLAAMEQPGDLVGFWDADLATPLALVDEFRGVLETRPDVSWVLGSRWRGLGRDIQRNVLRHYLSRVFATAVSILLGLPVYDTQCGAKVFRTDSLLRLVLAEPFASRWIFDVEILTRLLAAHRAGLASSPAALTYELPLRTWHHDGRSHVRAGDFIRAAVDLWRIRPRAR
jgi:glycosyltransferase involved in cell wall biosynthesis